MKLLLLILGVLFCLWVFYRIVHIAWEQDTHKRQYTVIGKHWADLGWKQTGTTLDGEPEYSIPME